MNRSFPLAQFSMFGRQFSVLNRSGSLVFPARHTPLAARHSRRAVAFTLIELLIVVAIIAILAGLTLSTLGYANKKGAESRARSEVAGLAAAIDSYKLEFGVYPADSNVLFAELTGQGTINTNRVIFEPTAGMATNNKFIDPWGSAYSYTTNATNNIGSFDLWTTNNEPGNPALWIRN